MANSVGWGIIGLGNIAEKFAKDLALVHDAALMGVASRSLVKANAFKKEFKVPFAFDNYDSLFDCEEVEVVYIALPHTEHLAWSIKAMEKGKHVLCEKPAGINRQQVEAMIAASKKNKVFFMEALWSRFIPSIRKIKDSVDAGEIGAVGYLQADFAFFALDRDSKGRLLNPELAGGSLLDIGIYPVFLAYLILGMPDDISADAKFIETGTEVQIAVTFTYKAAHAHLFSGLTATSPMTATIAGNDGTLVIHSRWHEAQGFTLDVDGQKEDFHYPTVGKGYTYEIEEVHRCLAENSTESPFWSHKQSLELISLLDKIREIAGIRFPFEG
ncbi:MAG: Gfo/Idh/MocA family oxidoreductase [Muriicola sp.]|nr:Gfo/Idh/MocA family oxidoreductase [Muriicola sp.]NNK11040.1 Gfo/Idh/MocA family oxidoreductase [Flavobacteriaceae bacterium]